MADSASSSNPSSTFKTHYVIDKLNGTNYQVWKHRMELYLKQCQLWDVVSGAERPQQPKDKAPTAKHDAFKAWQAKDINAQMELILHCQDRQVQMVRTLTTAQAIWKHFANSYEHTDLIVQVSLIKKLVTTNMAERQSSTKFLDDWQVILDGVLISGLTIPDQLKAMLFMPLFLCPEEHSLRPKPLWRICSFKVWCRRSSKRKLYVSRLLEQRSL